MPASSAPRSRAAIALACAGRAQPEAVVEQREQLRADEAHLAGELHAWSCAGDHAVDALRVQHDDRLGAEQAVLGAAEAQDVDAGIRRELAERHAERGGRVPDAGAVHVQGHAVGVREVGDRAHLGGRVQRAELGGLGDATRRAGCGAVLVVPAPRLGGDQLGGELAVGRRHREQLEAGHLLGGAALVGVDVRGAWSRRRRPSAAAAR